jgi:hypothetical protein
MLVILHGVDSTKKPKLAKKIFDELNNISNYQMGDYVIDFTESSFAIYNNEGDLVFRPGPHEEATNQLLINSDGSKNEEGHEIVARAVEFKEITIDKTNADFHFLNEFSNFAYDYQIDQDIDFIDEYNLLISNYNNSQFSNVVIYGSFSKAFVEKIRTDLGAENVSVISIIRNPSASFLINTILPGHQYEDRFNDAPLGIKFATEELTASIINAISLQDLPYVTTIRFEDLMDQSFIYVNGIPVKLLDLYKKHNSYILESEFNNLNLTVPDDLELFNLKYSGYNVAVGYNSLPGNVFAALGYLPLTYSELIQ